MYEIKSWNSDYKFVVLFFIVCSVSNIDFVFSKEVRMCSNSCCSVPTDQHVLAVSGLTSSSIWTQQLFRYSLSVCLVCRVRGYMKHIIYNQNNVTKSHLSLVVIPRFFSLSNQIYIYLDWKVFYLFQWVLKMPDFFHPKTSDTFLSSLPCLFLFYSILNEAWIQHFMH